MEGRTGQVGFSHASFPGWPRASLRADAGASSLWSCCCCCWLLLRVPHGVCETGFSTRRIFIFILETLPDQVTWGGSGCYKRCLSLMQSCWSLRTRFSAIVWGWWQPQCLVLRAVLLRAKIKRRRADHRMNCRPELFSVSLYVGSPPSTLPPCL